MSQEQRTFLAIALMLGILFLYQAVFAPKRPPQPGPGQTAGRQQETAQATPAPKPIPPPQAAGIAPEREVTVETSRLSVVLTSHGGGVKAWRLKDYVIAKQGPVDIVAPVPPGAAPPLSASGYDGLPTPEAYVADKTELRLTRGDEAGQIRFVRRDENGLEIEKRIRFHGDGYKADIELRFRNTGGRDLPVEPKIFWGPGFHENEKKDGARGARPPTIWLDGARVEDVPKDIKPGALRIHEGQVSWAAQHDTYFSAALIPEEKGVAAVVAKSPDGEPWIGLRAPGTVLRPGQEVVFRAQVYGGPNDLEKLAAAAPQLDRLVNLGYFFFGTWSVIDYWLARPALVFLRFLRGITGNYGLAIILLTIIIKAALFPLTQKSLKSMQAMQALQPKIQAIREKYKQNKAKQNQEMGELMRRNNVSGLSGCLPMIVQMPVFIGLYNALANAIELWQARFLWVEDLSAPEAGLFALPKEIPFLAGTEFRLLPLLMGVSQFLQMKLSPTGADPAQAAMMTYVMPVFMTAIFYGFPSGLVLYWLCFNLLQIAQQHLLNKSKAKLPAPDQAAGNAGN